MDDKDTGLYQKYNVRRTDGHDLPGEKHDGCSYFVLDLDHDKFAIHALLTYAAECRDEYPLLYVDILKLLAGVHESKEIDYQMGYDSPEVSKKPSYWVVEVVMPGDDTAYYLSGVVMKGDSRYSNNIIGPDKNEAIKFLDEEEAISVSRKIKWKSRVIEVMGNGMEGK